MTGHLTLTRPDDWHLHLRDGAALAAVLPDTARQFARAIVMPNLKPPVTTTAVAAAYRERILAARPAGSDFEPLMTLYLTDNTSGEEIARAAESGFVHAVKLYPAGATTNSDAGVTDLARCHAALEAMQRLGLPLYVHGEVTDREIDVFDRERVFIDTQLIPLRAENFPGCVSSSNTSPRRTPPTTCAKPQATSPPRSPRTTCSTTAMRSSTGACGRTGTACRCSSASAIARRW
jgi:dihydroorotase